MMNENYLRVEVPLSFNLFFTPPSTACHEIKIQNGREGLGGGQTTLTTIALKGSNRDKKGKREKDLISLSTPI